MVFAARGIWAIATGVIAKHGLLAIEIAEAQAERALAKGDREAHESWLAVRHATELLLRPVPEPGEWVN
jgi:hypothetical protein